jgi:type IV pilus assembly protein PilV
MKSSFLNQSVAVEQRGIALLETLIAVVVFSIGVLGLIGLLGISVKSSSDAKYRADAAYLANQVVSRMWVDQTNVGSYAHNAAAAACSAAGGASATSAYAPLQSWLTSVAAALPGGGGARQRIVVDTATVPGTTIVTVTMCWHGPQDTDAAGNDVYHNYTATTQIAG